MCIASLSLEQWSNVATIGAAIVGVGALVYAAFQLKHSSTTSEGQFLLDLEKMSYTHNEVHIKLRPGGEWACNSKGPKDHKEWAKLEDYMGFFELCELLMQDGSLCPDRFEQMFGYRVNNIVANEIIDNAKLIEERDSWELFLKLVDRGLHR
jgi:hypothetical protein